MASILTENSQAGDKVIFEDIMERAYPGYKKMSANAILMKMVSDGVIQVDGLFEKAISVVGSHVRDSTTGRDFADGSDAKKAVTRQETKNGYTFRCAKIAKLENKTGDLRVIVGDPKSGKTYYFKIPASKIAGKKSIKITFSEHGLPDGSTWFDYCVKTFEELSA